MACALASVIVLWPESAYPQVKEKEIPLAPPRKDGPVNFDPSDVYFQGWLLSRDAEKLQADKHYSEALAKLQRARELFDDVATYHPMWKREMVGGRRIQTQEAIDTVAPLAIQEKEAEQREVAALEGGVIKGAPAKPLQGGPAAVPVPPVREIESLDTRRIAELEKRVQELQAELAAKPETTAPSNGSSREADRSRDIAKQRDMARADLKRALDEIAQLRQSFAAGPVREEMEKLTNRIGSLEREKAAVGQALSKSQAETLAAKADVAALQVERARLRQVESDLRRNLDLEREQMTKVTAAQQKQLSEYREQLRAATDRENKANQKIASLEETLRQVRQSFDELKLDRDNLLRERDQMSQLLQQDEGKRITALIDQNMGLGKKVREAEEKLARLNEENNANLDARLEVMRDLTIAKQNINELKREKFAQDQRMADLEKRLQSEDQNLAEGKGDPAEVQTLREMIQKQLRQQEFRRQSSQVLLDALKDTKDEKVRKAVEMYQDVQEEKLTPEELAFLGNHSVDGKFVSPFRRSQGEVDAAVAELERENQPLADVAKRAFLSQRFEASRELFSTLLERNPGDIAARCQMGVVQLRLGDFPAAAETFRKASELETSNPYAFRMLGLALYESGDLGEAIKMVEESVKLAPSNTDGRILLGKLYFEAGQEDLSEEQLKSAITYDDSSPIPHLNLAQLYAKQGKKEKGREHLNNAEERGAAPDLDLHKRLATTAPK